MRVNDGLWQCFYDTFDVSGVKTQRYILTALLVILKNTEPSYLTHRHAAHTWVQDTRPCIGAHFTDEREPLLPVDTVEMDWLPLKRNKQLFTHGAKHRHIVIPGFLNVLQFSRRLKMNFDPPLPNKAESVLYSLHIDRKMWGWSRQAGFSLSFWGTGSCHSVCWGSVFVISYMTHFSAKRGYNNRACWNGSGRQLLSQDGNKKRWNYNLYSTENLHILIKKCGQQGFGFKRASQVKTKF